MILSAIAAKLKQRSKGDFKDRHYEAALILQAVAWYLRYLRPTNVLVMWKLDASVDPSSR